jgi:hypothetical protein
MTLRKVLVTGVKIVAVCLAFAFCTVVGAALSGLNKIAQTASPPSGNVQQVPPTRTPASPLIEGRPKAESPQAPENPAAAFLALSLFAGVVVSYVILRSSWNGWPLTCAMFVGIYGIATVATQIDSVFFLSDKLPRGMIRAIFLQGAIATALFSPLAVLLLGKWRTPSQPSESPGLLRMGVVSAAWRLALIVLAFVSLYMFFGYYVAWQNPSLREYYGGPAYPNFFASLKANWINRPWIYPLQAFRALVYVACLYPLVRMMLGARWETVLAVVLFLSVWTTALLLPNPMMPSSVARSHFWETLGFSLVFGALTGWLLWKRNQVDEVNTVPPRW